MILKLKHIWKRTVLKVIHRFINKKKRRSRDTCLSQPVLWKARKVEAKADGHWTDWLCRRRDRRVLTVTPQPHQTTIITLYHKMKKKQKQTNSNFIAVLMKCAICEKTQWTLSQSILPLSSCCLPVIYWKWS